MDKRFLAAFLTPRSTRLLGYNLYPWCLKHRIQLTALESPMMSGGEVSAGDLMVFAKVCSEKPIGGKATLRDRWQLLRMGLREDGLRTAYRVAAEHMRSDTWPKFWEQPKTEGGEARGGGIPWALAVLSNLMRNGLTLEEALHLPEAQAVWLSTAHSVHAGAKIEVLTTDDEALLDSLSTVERSPNEPKPTV